MDAIEKFGVVLSTTPPIVESILNNLGMKDLYSCASVCKLWNNIVNTIKKKRKGLFWALIAGSEEVQTYRIMGMWFVHPHNKICEMKDYDCFDHSYNIVDKNNVCYANPLDIPTPLRTFFLGDLARASSDPKFAILFCSQQLFEKLQMFVHYVCVKSERSKGQSSTLASRKKDEKIYSDKVMKFLSSHFPKSCNIMICAAPGIVGTLFNNTSPEEIESSPALGGIFFPSLNGVDMYQFPINNKMSLNCLPAVTGIPEDQKVKCLLIFTMCVPSRKEPAGKLIEHYLKDQKNEMALGGAIIDEVFCRTNSSKTSSGIGIAFVGNNVQATSVILKENVRSSASVEEQLKKLQSSVVLGDQNCAFMFACVARGGAFYKHTNVEASSFHKLFPSVPLFGVFGNGEIGIEYLPNSAQKKEKSSKFPSYYHSYTTVFVLLSLKR